MHNDLEKILDDFMRQMHTALGNDPVIQDVLKEVREIAGHDQLFIHGKLPQFANLTNYANTRPLYIAKWRSTKETETKKYLRHMNSFENSQKALIQTYYHRNKIAEIDTKVSALIKKYDLSKMIRPGQTIAGANTLILDFEYQNFILAVRRALEYLVLGFAIYFDKQFSSFNDFGKELKKLSPNVVAEALLKVYENNEHNFNFVISRNGRKSLRDRISHYEFIQAGTINISANGLVLCGGGENFLPNKDWDYQSLSVCLDNYLKVTEAVISELLEAFIKADKTISVSSSSTYI